MNAKFKIARRGDSEFFEEAEEMMRSSLKKPDSVAYQSR
jgi:hypothetical protein